MRYFRTVVQTVILDTRRLHITKKLVQSCALPDDDNTLYMGLLQIVLIVAYWSGAKSKDFLYGF